MVSFLIHSFFGGIRDLFELFLFILGIVTLLSFPFMTPPDGFWSWMLVSSISVILGYYIILYILNNTIKFLDFLLRKSRGF